MTSAARLSGIRSRCIYPADHVSTEARVRTNIVLDDALIAEAMERTGIKTKRAVVEEALKTLVRLRRQEEILKLRGQLHWEGDLGEMRRDRDPRR
jgi:Arc/MetJ family transcription regulator